MDGTTIDPIAAMMTNSSATPATTGNTELGRNEFLQLLVAKLENQDPLNPAQDTEFVAQLATFSSLEQLIDANQNLQSIAVGQSDLVNAQALELIGKEALVENDSTLSIRNGKPDTLVYVVPQAAREVTLTVMDERGTVVRTFELETVPSGRVTLEWDGTGDDDAEQVLPDGEYSLSVSASDLEGKPMQIALYRSLRIDGVTFIDGWISLVSGDQVIPFDRILEFRAGS